MGLSKAVVKNRVLILMIALILLVPAVFGMLVPGSTTIC